MPRASSKARILAWAEVLRHRTAYESAKSDGKTWIALEHAAALSAAVGAFEAVRPRKVGRQPGLPYKRGVK